MLRSASSQTALRLARCGPVYLDDCARRARICPSSQRSERFSILSPSSGLTARIKQLQRERWPTGISLDICHNGWRHAASLSDGQHDLDAVALLVSTLVIFDGFFTRLTLWDTGSDPDVYKVVAEPICVIPAIPEQSIRCWKSTHEGACACIATDMSSSHEEPYGPPNRVGHGIQFRIHTTFGATY
jgi:hypothetical protein